MSKDYFGIDFGTTSSAVYCMHTNGDKTESFMYGEKKIW